MAFQYHDEPEWVKYYVAIQAIVMMYVVPVAGIVAIILMAVGVL